MKRLLLSIALVCLFVWAKAQGKFQFTEEVHDFGTIEEGTIAKYDFEFKNIGNRPLILESVKASCGCTTPYFTKTPISPNMKGKISVSFNSSGRTGNFHKSIAIKSNSKETHAKVIYIKGFINPKYNPNQSQKSVPVLSINKTVQNVGTLKKGQSAIARFVVKNTGAGQLLLTGISSQCNCIVGSIPKSNLSVSESTTIEIKYTPTKSGSVRDVIYLYSNDGRNGLTKLYITATVEQESIMKSKKGF